MLSPASVLRLGQGLVLVVPGEVPVARSGLALSCGAPSLVQGCFPGECAHRSRSVRLGGFAGSLWFG